MRENSYNAPRSYEELMLMNARKKEKKQLLIDGKKPKSIPDWIERSEHMIKWFHDNPGIKNFLSYPLKHKFTWSDFKQWITESEVFSKAMEQCIQICLERREGYLETNEELCKIFIEEQVLYNPMLADYKEKMARIKQDTNSILKAGQPIILYEPLKVRVKKEKK
jgi:hypothetical protein